MLQACGFKREAGKRGESGMKIKRKIETGRGESSGFVLIYLDRQ